ncbi:hypothetical protein V8D89_016277, partial [Ganoderma adspersum]
PGLQSLHQLVKALIPLVHPLPPTEPTTLQSFVSANPDFFLPFCELAPSCMAVTSSTGPCHRDNCKQPGAFASSIIFRVGLFASPLLLQNRRVSLYWADNATWEADLDAHKVLWCSKDTRSSYVNIFAYSKQPLANCADFFDHVPIYFAQDSL